MREENLIIYEQPLNEVIRASLRFEFLFNQIKHYLNSETEADNRVALNYIIELLSLADRSDLRTKLSKAINEHIASLSQLTKIPDIDNAKLQEVLEQLQSASALLHRNQGKLCQDLRGNEFLFSIAQRFSTPGGMAPFYLAPYHLWLKLKNSDRKNNLNAWFSKLSELEEIINLILNLTRDSTDFVPKVAEKGFYQISLDASVPYQLLRLQVAVKDGVYPEISVGRHRMAVHLFSLNVEGHAKQTSDDIAFDLACCKI